MSDLERLVVSPFVAILLGLAILAAATIKYYFPDTFPAQLTTLAIAACGLLWSAGVIRALARWQSNTLYLYAALIAAIYLIEIGPFGVSDPYRYTWLKAPLTWLQVLALVLALELMIVDPLRSLSRPLHLSLLLLLHLPIIGVIIAIPTYYLLFSSNFDPNVTLAVLQTTSAEAFELLPSLLKPLTLACLMSAIAIAVSAIYWHHLQKQQTFPARSAFAIALVALPQALFAYVPTRLHYAVFETIGEHRRFARDLLHHQSLRQEAKALSAQSTSKNGLYVLVLGESHGRDHSSLYGYDRPTMPWMDTQKRNSNWLIFQNAYANHTMTIRAVPMALTAANQYNGKRPEREPSLIELAKAAGFDAYWLTNQLGLGDGDNGITSIAKTSNHYVRSDDKFSHRSETGRHFDDVLLNMYEKLSPKIDTTKNNLIVFHLIGSHYDYCRRFPAEFKKFGLVQTTPSSTSTTPEIRPLVPKRQDGTTVDCYDNSILFTDAILEKIFTAAAQTGQLKAFVYLSDHGDDPTFHRRADPKLFDFNLVRIPLAVWLSDTWYAENTILPDTLHSRVSRVWTNDLLLELMIGITGIKQEHGGVPTRYNLLADDYALNWDNAQTMQGTRPISEDRNTRRDPTR